MEDKYFDILIKLAKKAAKKQEVPISALLVCNDKIIAKSYNSRQKTNQIFNHAEINVIKKASKKLKRWHLNDCILYVTLKPCKMCEAAINQSQIRKVYYIVDKENYKREYNKTIYEQTNIRTQENKYKSILKSFFQKKRDKHPYI